MWVMGWWRPRLATKRVVGVGVMWVAPTVAAATANASRRQRQVGRQFLFHGAEHGLAAPRSRLHGSARSTMGHPQVQREMMLAAWYASPTGVTSTSRCGSCSSSGGGSLLLLVTGEDRVDNRFQSVLELLGSRGSGFLGCAETLVPMWVRSLR